MRRGSLEGIALALVLVPTLARAVCPPGPPLCSSPVGTCEVVEDVTVCGEGGAIDLGGRSLVIRQGKVLRISPGPLTIFASGLEVEPNARIEVEGASALERNLAVQTTGDIVVRAIEQRRGKITVASNQEGGTVVLETVGAGFILIQGTIDVGGKTQAGSLVLHSAVGDVTMGGDAPILADARRGGDLATGGTVNVLADGGSIQVAGPIFAPGGNGGIITLRAGLDVRTTGIGTLAVDGSGSGLGGQVEIRAGRNVELKGKIDAAATGVVGPGNGRGGQVRVFARGDLTQEGIIRAGGRSESGQIRLRGNGVSIGGAIDGKGVIQGNAGGFIQIHACRLLVLQDGRIDATGPRGRNILQANETMEVRGSVLSSPPPDGRTRLEYANPLFPPLITGSIVPAPALRLNPGMAPCGGGSFFCGNGALDPNEECDDGNIDDCDQCDSICRLTICGNGRLDCLEDCDDGNRLPGDCCDTTCLAEPDGRSCPSDDDLCTRSQACDAGVCVGINPVVCIAQDDCHLPGECSAESGTCTNPLKPDGSACDDFNACTADDVCDVGICVPGGRRTCDDGDPCTDDNCDPITGCSNPRKRGLRSVQCSFTPPPGPCAGQTFPPKLKRLYDRAPLYANEAVTAPATPPALVKRLERRAARILKKVSRLAIRSARKRKISVECAKAIRRIVSDALVDVRTRR